MRVKSNLTLRGAYPADRAAALAGVPVSTVYYWARRGVYAPTLSSEKVMLWSWADLLALRAISWLRSVKPDISNRPTTMLEVRNIIRVLEDQYGRRLGDHLVNRSVVLNVDSAGKPYIRVEDMLARPLRSGDLQTASGELMVDLLSEYETGHGLRGPHLLRPRPNLRIIPGKLGGEPHIQDTRIETRIITALIRRGYETSRVLEFYPFLDATSLEQAVDLEDQLDQNLARRAA